MNSGKKDKCPDCGGIGKMEGSEADGWPWTACSTCDGTGKVQPKEGCPNPHCKKWEVSGVVCPETEDGYCVKVSKEEEPEKERDWGSSLSDFDAISPAIPIEVCHFMIEMVDEIDKLRGELKKEHELNGLLMILKPLGYLVGLEREHLKKENEALRAEIEGHKDWLEKCKRNYKTSHQEWTQDMNALRAERDKISESYIQLQHAYKVSHEEYETLLARVEELALEIEIRKNDKVMAELKKG